jgi:hypothetical protein
MGHESATALACDILAQTKPTITKIPRLLAIQGLLLGMYLFWVAAIVPITRLTDWPSMRWDYSYHYSQVAEIGDLMRTRGGSWGYSDLFSAGYPLGVQSNLGSKGWTWFVHLLSYLSVPTVTAFNLYIALWVVLMPLVIYRACRWFGLSPSQATVATVMDVVYRWTSSFYYLFHMGMISFLASTLLATFSVAALYAYVRDGHWRYGAAFGLSAAICCWVHALSVIYLAIGCAIVYLTRFRRLTLRQHGALFLLGSIALVAQWPWLGPYLAISKWFVKSSGHLVYGQVQGLGESYLGTVSSLQTKLPLLLACAGAVLVSAHLRRRDRKLAWLFLTGAAIFLLAGALVETPLHRLFLIGGAVGVYAWWRQRKPTLVLLFIILPAVLLFLGYGGTRFAALRPARHMAVAYLWLAIPTAAGGQRVYDVMRRSKQHRRALGAGVALLALSVWPVVSPQIARFLAQEPITLIRSPSQEAGKLVNWLQTNTTREGRILFEDSPYWLTEHKVSAGYLAYTSQRAFIGGPFPWGGPVDFVDGRPFGHPIETMTTSQMADYFDLYNIHWVIVYSQASRNFFDARPDLVEPVEESGFARIYRVKMPGNYFLEGIGRLTVRNHQIELWDVQGSEIVLKYHWIPNLKSSPKVDIEKVMVSPDPHGFIRIIAPPDRLTIWVAP